MKFLLYTLFISIVSSQINAIDNYVMVHIPPKQNWSEGYVIYQNGTLLGGVQAFFTSNPPYKQLEFGSENAPAQCPGYPTDLSLHGFNQNIDPEACYDCYTTLCTIKKPCYFWQSGELNSYLVFDTSNLHPLPNATHPVQAWLTGAASHFATIGYVSVQDNSVNIYNAENRPIAWAVETPPLSYTFPTDKSWDISINSTAISSPDQQELTRTTSIFFAVALHFYNGLLSSEQCQQTCINERNNLIGGLVGGIGGVAVVVGAYIAWKACKYRAYQEMPNVA